MVHWWMQVVETGGAPGDAGLMVTWPLHVPLKSGYVTGAVELLQPAHVTQTKMLIDFQRRCVIPVTRFLSIMGSVRRRRCGGGRDSVAAYTADRPFPVHDGDGQARREPLPRLAAQDSGARIQKDSSAALRAADLTCVALGVCESLQRLRTTSAHRRHRSRTARRSVHRRGPFVSTGTKGTAELAWVASRRGSSVRSSIGLGDAIVTCINWLR